MEFDIGKPPAGDGGWMIRTYEGTGVSKERFFVPERPAEQDRERKPFFLEIQCHDRLSRRFLEMNQSEHQKLNELIDMFILYLAEQ